MYERCERLEELEGVLRADYTDSVKYESAEG
jgi:hypothetical protein